jgi:hypothetical protein
MHQQQPNPYNQFMKAMPSPVGAPQRGSFTQFPNAPQMNQFRMMQQQPQHHQSQPGQQQMNYGQPPQAMQQMPQFFPQMGQQQYAQQPMPMPGQVVGPPGGIPMNMQPNNAMRQNMPQSDDQNDPLFMLKDM